MGKKRKTACAPGIWKKLTAAEKRWWRMFYRDFLGEMRATKDLMPHALTDDRRRVIAHNHACLAVWAMRGPLKRSAGALLVPDTK